MLGVALSFAQPHPVEEENAADNPQTHARRLKREAKKPQAEKVGNKKARESGEDHEGAVFEHDAELARRFVDFRSKWPDSKCHQERQLHTR